MLLTEKYLPQYTYDDYCKWEGCWELIDGIPWAMNTEFTPVHQSAAGNIYVALEIGVRKSIKKCKTYPRIDWKITDTTVIQPDALIVFNKIEKDFLDFPPALVVEILSPSTAVKDRNIKMEIYQQQQVKYYLILDPEFNKTEIYQLQQGVYKQVAENPAYFTFILQDECSIDVSFTEVWD